MSTTETQDKFADLPSINDTVSGRATEGVRVFTEWRERFLAQNAVAEKIRDEKLNPQDFKDTYPVCSEIDAGRFTLRQMGQEAAHLMALIEAAKDVLERMVHETHTHFSEEIAEMYRRGGQVAPETDAPFFGGVREVA